MLHEESGLGVIEYSEEVAALNEKKPEKKRVQFTEEERFKIGKYIAVNGVKNAERGFKKSPPHLNFDGYTARKLKDRYSKITKQEKTIIPKCIS